MAFPKTIEEFGRALLNLGLMIADSWWALMIFALMVGIIIAMWIGLGFFYENRKTQQYVGWPLTVFIIITYATVINKLLNGLIWPYIVLVAIWGLLGARLGKVGFVLGLVLFYGMTIHCYVWPEFWLWAESW